MTVVRCESQGLGRVERVVRRISILKPRNNERGYIILDEPTARRKDGIIVRSKCCERCRRKNPTAILRRKGYVI
jgi:hypothetical protein